jgi:hypothetical protein
MYIEQYCKTLIIHGMDIVSQLFPTSCSASSTFGAIFLFPLSIPGRNYLFLTGGKLLISCCTFGPFKKKYI